MADPIVPPLLYSHILIATPLVSLTVAKLHLRITDSAHDADITQKTAAAQDFVLRRMSYAVDPAWTEATLPDDVKNSILLLLDALYELRGGEDPDEKLKKTWDVIGHLLGVHRDPTLA